MAFAFCDSADGGGDGAFPEEIADEVVFADVVAEEVDARVVGVGGWGGGGGEGV